MNKFSISRFTVSRLHNEIMIVYRGDMNIFVKKFTFNPRRFMRKLSFVGVALVLTLLLVVFLPFGKGEADSSNPDDQTLKNDLMVSETTDFSEPEEDSALTIQIYKVQQGDTLSEIAGKFGVSMETIIGSSGLESYDYLKIGQTLKIPDKDGLLVKIKDGQRLIDIAKKYNVDVDKIVASNQLLNPDFLPVGYDIFVPDAKPQNIFNGWMWPSPSHVVTSAYGWRVHPISGRRQFHHGMDIRARYQWIKAAKYGKVTFAGNMGGYGRAVIIAHPGGWKTLYAHLSRIIVKKGQYVKQGQTIAKSGNTGYSAGPHLHFEIRKNGKHMNPRSYLKK